MDDFPSDRQTDRRQSARQLSSDEMMRNLTIGGPGDSDVDLGALMHAVWRLKLVVFLFIFFAMVAATAYVYAVTPLYRATSVVMLDNRDSQVIDLEGVVGGLGTDRYTIQTEVEVLRSRSLAERVVEQAKLEDYKFFNPMLKEKVEPNPYNVFNLLFAGLDAFKGAIRSLVQEGEQDDKLDLPDDYWQRQLTINSLLARVNIEPREDTYVYALTVETDDPRLSAGVANAYADLYITEQLEVKFEATRAATTWLSGRVAELKVELEKAEAAREDFASKTTLVSEEQLEGASRQIKDLRERAADLDAQAAAAAARLQKLSSLDGAGDIAAAADLTGAPRLIGLARDVLATPAGADRDALMQRFSAELERQAERIRIEAERASAQAEAVRRSVTELETQFNAQSADLVQLRQLEREAEASRLIYEYFLNRMKEISVQQGVQQADSRVLSPAVIPIVPSYPKKQATVLLAGIFGGLLACLLIIAREQMNRSFRATEELEAHSGLPVLGAIPIAPVRRRRAVLEYAVRKPGSALVESIRNLRTGVLMANVDRPPQVVMLTSSLPKEGKTTSSILLAQNAAALGKSVLLMECDLRRRTFRAYFPFEGETRGLLSVLSGQVSFEDAVVHDELSGLDIMMGDDTKTNAADVFASQKFAAFIQQMRGRYDMIVIDTPPVLAVPDARVIAPLADSVVYCVHWNQTHRDLVRKGIQSFTQIGVRLTGLNMTQIDTKRMASYGYSAYGAYYSASTRYYLN